jgi:acetyl esterase/lipase
MEHPLTTLDEVYATDYHLAKITTTAIAPRPTAKQRQFVQMPGGGFVLGKKFLMDALAEQVVHLIKF